MTADLTKPPLLFGSAPIRPATRSTFSHRVNSLATRPTVPVQDVFVRRSQSQSHAPLRFGADAEDSPSRLARGLSGPTTQGRMAVLDKLLNRPAVEDPDLQRALARYLYFEDVYSTNDRVRGNARIRLLEVAGKYPLQPWMNETLLMNMAEVGNTNFTKAAAAIIRKQLSTLPPGEAERFRSEVIRALIRKDGSNEMHFRPIIKELMTPRDLNYLHYLSEGSSYTDSMRRYFRHYLVDGIYKLYGAEGFEALLATQRSQVENGENATSATVTPGAAGLDFKPSAMENMIEQLPEVILGQSSVQMATIPPQERLRMFDALWEHLVWQVKQPEQPKETYRKVTCRVLNHLASGLDAGTRKKLASTVFRQALGFADKACRQQPLALGYSLLYGPPYTYGDFQDSFIDKLRYKEEFYSWFENAAYPTGDVAEGEPDLEGLRGFFEKILEKNPNTTFTHPSDTLRVDSPADQLTTALRDLKNAFSMDALPACELPANTIQSLPRTWPLEPLHSASELKPEDINIYKQSDKALAYIPPKGGVPQTLAMAIKERLNLWVQTPLVRDEAFLRKLTATAPGFNLFTTQVKELMNQVVREVPTSGLGWRVPAKNIPLGRALRVMHDALDKMPEGSGLELQMIARFAMYAAGVSHELAGAALSVLLKASRKAELASMPDDAMPLKYVAATVLAISRLGVSDSVIRENRDILAAVMPHTPRQILAGEGNDFYGNGLDWPHLSNGALEKDTYGNKGLNTNAKLNLNLLNRFVGLIDSSQLTASWIDGLWTSYNAMRAESYVDELPLVDALALPNGVELAERLPDDAEGTSRFNQFCEMLGWYKVYEAIPALVRGSLNNPDLARATVMAATVTRMGLFAVPDLEKLMVEGTPTEQDRATILLETVRGQTSPQELFSPFPYPLPPAFLKRVDTIRRRRDARPDEAASPGSIPPEGQRLAGAANPLDLSALLNATPSASDAGQAPTSSDSPGQRPAGKGFRAAENPIRLIGFDTELAGRLPKTLMGRMSELLERLTAGQAASEQAVLARGLKDTGRQVNAMARNPESGLAFNTSERRRLETDLVAYLQGASSLTPEVRANLLDALSGIATEPESAVQLSELYYGERTPAVVGGLLRLMQNVGAGNPDIALQAALNEELPEAVRLDAVNALQRMNSNLELLGLVGMPQGRLPDAVTVAAIDALAENMPVSDDQNAQMNVLSLFRRLLPGAAAGSAIQTALMNGLRMLADEEDGASVDALVTAAATASPEAVGALLEDFENEIFPLTQNVRSFLTRLGQEGNNPLAARARQLLDRDRT